MTHIVGLPGVLNPGEPEDAFRHCLLLVSGRGGVSHGIPTPKESPNQTANMETSNDTRSLAEKPSETSPTKHELKTVNSTRLEESRVE